MGHLELWGGCECTVNRVAGRFHDQTARSGHQGRLSDLDLIAGLGVKTLRYPVLWERIAPKRPDQLDLAWTDQRLARLQQLGVRPIVGLVHHGSGPRYTHLLDSGFAPGLGDFAGRVAARYPWVQDWTPVNEPLTTARFSALYGHWYPHLMDEPGFWTALLNQIDGVRLAMRAIRTVNPAARLIQTEDLGRTWSTRAVAHQAEFDNARRWMSWDLLEGRVVNGHPLWERLCAFGLQDRLQAIADDPCPPDVLGVNHYLTSDRFLDHRTDNYPPDRRGGNEFMSFADVEAVRVLQPGPDGLEGVLQEAWSRYGRTIAVTESHNGCTRDEQMRWLLEAWRTAERLRRRGVDLCAVTSWALLGSYDWNSLLTRNDGCYEPGAFDVSAGRPRPTAVADLIAALAAGRELDHPALASPGWWRRDIRLEFRPVPRALHGGEPRREWRTSPGMTRPLLIAGATGTLGKAFARACEWRGLDYVLTSRAELDLHDPAVMARMLEAYEPWGVINAAGWVRVDDAEQEVEGCMQANATGAIALGRACAAAGAPLVSFSSDLVFDGRSPRAYVESDAPGPLNVYGRSKAEAEAGLLALPGRNLVIRTAAFFSPHDPYNFAAHVARQLVRDEPVLAADDLVVSPTYVPDLVDAALDLLIDGETGIWHLANQGAVSWAEFANQIAEALRLEHRLIEPRPWRSLGWAAERPAFTPLSSERSRLMPSLDDAVGRYAAAMLEAEFSTLAEPIEHPIPAAGVRTRGRL